jgi:hypothetical protein
VALSAGLSSDKGTDTLKLEKIVLAEFDRMSGVAKYARKEAQNLFNLYLLAGGVFATGLSIIAQSYNQTNKVTITLIETVLLGCAALLSFAFFARQLDLTSEYFRSQRTIRGIHELYLRHFGNERLAGVLEDAPGRLRRTTAMGAGTAITSATIALLGGLAAASCFGQARQVYALATNHAANFAPEIILGGLAISYFWEVVAGLLWLTLHAIFFMVVTSRSQ